MEARATKCEFKSRTSQAFLLNRGMDMNHILKAWWVRIKSRFRREKPLPPCRSWQEARERVYSRKPPEFPVVTRAPVKERRSKRMQARLVSAAERKREKRLDKRV